MRKGEENANTFLHFFICIFTFILATHACVVLVCNVNEAKCDDEKGRKASSLIYSDLKKH